MGETEELRAMLEYYHRVPDSDETLQDRITLVRQVMAATNFSHDCLSAATLLQNEESPEVLCLIEEAMKKAWVIRSTKSVDVSALTGGEYDIDADIWEDCFWLDYVNGIENEKLKLALLEWKAVYDSECKN